MDREAIKHHLFYLKMSPKRSKQNRDKQIFLIEVKKHKGDTPTITFKIKPCELLVTANFCYEGFCYRYRVIFSRCINQIKRNFK